MCCMFTTLVLFGPRLGILFWWLLNPARFNLAFDDRWLLIFLAWLFIPWTVLMFLIVFPGGIQGFDWVWLILGIVADVASYSGGVYGNRNTIPGYQE